MSINIRHSLCSAATIILLSLSMLVTATAFAKNKLPETSHDGLHLQKDTKLAAVYLKPGETLKEYDKVAITDVVVSFKKNWQRNYNSETIGLDGRVTDKDVEIIKKRLAKEFREVFVNELRDNGGYEVVDTAAKDVLMLQPNIMNLVVTVPDVTQASMGRSFVASAGEMTLYLELYDSLTSDILARVEDVQAAGSYGVGHMSNRVKNKAEFDKVLTRWAKILRSHLDDINGK